MFFTYLFSYFSNTTFLFFFLVNLICVVKHLLNFLPQLAFAICSSVCMQVMVQFYNFGLNLFQNHFYCFPTSFNFLKLSLFQPLTQKKWKYCNGSIISEDNKKVIPKQQHYHVQLYRCNVLRPQPNSTSWKTSIMKWFTKNYTEIDKKVVNLFVKMCKFHQEHRTIKGKVKPVKQPLEAESFLSLLEIDLMDC